MSNQLSKVSWCNVCDDCQRHPCICMVGGAETRHAYPEACHWPDRPFRVVDEPGEHAPCYLVMPDGASLAFVHHATNGVDQARAAFVANACNRALRIESATTPAEVDEPALPPLPLCWTGSPVSVTWAEDGEITTRKVYTAEQMHRYAIDHAATLARQLASVTESRDMAKGIIDALAAEMKAAGVELIDYKVVNTRADGLARQLAEANRLSTAISNDCNAVANERNALQSQLSEATRRLGEVDDVFIAMLAEEAYRVHSSTPVGPYPNDTHLPKWQAAVRMVIAALTKEPTK